MLTSAKNPRLQNIRIAAASGRPTPEGLIVAEGPHLFAEALGGGWHIEKVFATAAARDRYSQLLSKVDAEIVELSPRAFAHTASTDTAQEVMALLRPSTWSWQDLFPTAALLVVLDNIQDPGNAGTIVRSAEAFGATGLVFLKGSSRVANGKFLRATAGSIFRLPFLEVVEATELKQQARLHGINLFALAIRGSATLDDVDVRSSCALIVGNEGAGVSDELLGGAQVVSIPTGQVESLNAAVACSIALFEVHRLRTVH